MHKWLADFSKPIYKRIKICCKSMYSKNNWKNNFFVRASSLINFRKFTIFSTFHNSILINKPCVYSIVLPFVPSPQQLYYNNKYNKMFATRSWIFFLCFGLAFFGCLSSLSFEFTYTFIALALRLRVIPVKWSDILTLWLNCLKLIIDSFCFLLRNKSF